MILCRTDSYIKIDAATETFKDFISPSIGIFTNSFDNEIIEFDIPESSAPIINAVGILKSIS